MVVRRPGDTESRRTRSADSGTRLGRGFVQIPKRSFPRVLIRSRPFLSLDVVPLCVCPWREAPDRGLPVREIGRSNGCAHAFVEGEVAHLVRAELHTVSEVLADPGIGDGRRRVGLGVRLP